MLHDDSAREIRPSGPRVNIRYVEIRVGVNNTRLVLLFRGEGNDAVVDEIEDAAYVSAHRIESHSL